MNMGIEFNWIKWDLQTISSMWLFHRLFIQRCIHEVNTISITAIIVCPLNTMLILKEKRYMRWILGQKICGTYTFLELNREGDRAI